MNEIIKYWFKTRTERAIDAYHDGAKYAIALTLGLFGLALFVISFIESSIIATIAACVFFSHPIYLYIQHVKEEYKEHLKERRRNEL